MPELSRFLGIIIAMYYRDHGPPHFHALCGEYEAIVTIAAGNVEGFLPGRLPKRGNRCLVLLHWSDRHAAQNH